jgi:phosphoglycolate phosphatase
VWFEAQPETPALRLIIFDMDGTLVDTVSLIVATVGDAFTALGEKAPDEQAVRAISGISLDQAIAMLAPHADEKRVGELSKSYREHYHPRAGRESEPLFKGAIEAIDRLRAKPGNVLAVATGKGYSGAIALLDAHGIRSHFHSIQTPDHNRGKPDPQMIETAMTRAGASKAETVMIGDTVHDMKMARAAGVPAIGVAWGYHTREELRKSGADIVIESFDDLDHAIDKLIRNA